MTEFKGDHQTCFDELFCGTRARLGTTRSKIFIPIDRPQPAVEGWCYVHSGELEAGKVTKVQGFQRFQLRPTGFKADPNARYFFCRAWLRTTKSDNLNLFNRPQPAVERRCYVHSGELEAG